MEALFLRALRNEPVEHPPVWLMRQAGRYLVEYQEIKAKHSFLEMCTTPELALEVSLQPLRLFKMDASIVFADILLPLQAMGMKIDFNPGPKVHDPIRSAADVAKLTSKDPAIALEYVMRTISMLRAELTKMFPKDERRAVIGFAGAPWTMACYMIDQGPWKHFAGTQVFAVQNPEAIRVLLDKIADITADYLCAQLESGADAVQLFDSWGGVLNLDDYRRYSLPYTQKIFERVKKKGKPVILYVNGSAHLLEALSESGADCLSVDWRTPFAEVRARFRGPVQGNLDPAHLFGTRESVIARTEAMLAEAGPRGYIANLGHGVLQQTPRENVAAFVDTVRTRQRV